MQEHRDVPAGLIVLDNRDGHLSQLEDSPKYESFPHTYVLIEGHTRFEIAAALVNQVDKSTTPRGSLPCGTLAGMTFTSIGSPLRRHERSWLSGR